MAVRLREARTGKFSLATLAHRSGISDTTLGSIENGQRALTLQMAERLAEVLDIDAVELYATHALDQMRSAVSTMPERYRPATVATGLAKVKIALDINRELEAPDLSKEMLKEKDELVSRIADELRRLEDALRCADLPPRHAPSQRLRTQFKEAP